MSDFYTTMRAFTRAAKRSFPHIPENELERHIEALVFHLDDRWRVIPAGRRHRPRNAQPYQRPSREVDYNDLL